MKYENFYGSSHSRARKHVILFPGILFSQTPTLKKNVSLPVLLNVYEIMNFNLTAISTNSSTPQHKKRVLERKDSWKMFSSSRDVTWKIWWYLGVGLRSQLTGFPGQMTMMMSFCFLRYSFIFERCVVCCVSIKGCFPWNFRFICSTHRHFSCHHHRARRQFHQLGLIFKYLPPGCC